MHHHYYCKMSVMVCSFKQTKTDVFAIAMKERLQIHTHVQYIDEQERKQGENNSRALRPRIPPP